MYITKELIRKRDMNFMINTTQIMLSLYNDCFLRFYQSNFVVENKLCSCSTDFSMNPARLQRV